MGRLKRKGVDNTEGYDEYIPKVGGKCWEDLKQDMEEHLCKGI